MKRTLEGVSTYPIRVGGHDLRAETGYGIFRARLVEDEIPFTKVQHLWAKPSEIVDQLGRCHNVGESKLYCSNYIPTCLVECRAKENSKWVLTEYVFSESKTVTLIPLGLNGEKYLKEETNPNKIQNVLDGLLPTERKKQEIVNDYVRKAFKKAISKGNEYQYKKTAAIVDHFLLSDQLGERNVGIMYPSVASGLRGINFVFNGDFARECLEIKRAFFINLNKVNKQSGKFEISFFADGEIQGNDVVWRQNQVLPFSK